MKKIWHKFRLYLADNLAADQGRLIAWIPFLLACGIALYFCLPTEPNLWLTVGIFEIWLLLFYVFRYKNLHLFFMAGLLILCGFLNIQAQTIYKERQITKIEDKTITYIKGKIENISFSEKGKMRLLLTDVADFDKNLKGKFRITLTVQPANPQIGKCVEMIATVFPLTPLPVLNGYRLDRKYFYENISALGYTNSETFIIDCRPQNAENGFRQNLNTWRNKLLDLIDSDLDKEQSGVADAILLGEKSHLLKPIADNYRNSGLAHFLSVSGLHLGTIAGLIFFFVRFLLALFPRLALKYDIKKIAAVCAICFSGFYLMISGMAIPAQRAFIMTTVVLVGVIFDRQAISVRMVSFAALVILIIAPQALISISFQMSFAAVYALVAFYESYKQKSYHNRSLPAVIWLYLSGIVVCDLVASLATAPFSLYHFHRLAVYTSLGNLLAGPLIGLYIMPMVVICLLMLPCGLAFYPLKALGYGIDILNYITDFVAHLPRSVWQTDVLPLWALLLIVVGGFWLCVWQRCWRYWGIMPIIIGIFPLFFAAETVDFVFSPNAENIALRDNVGNLVMLSDKRDNWISDLWQENLQLKPLSKQERKMLHIEGLKCKDKGVCTYKNAVEFSSDGNIKFLQEAIDTSAGGYIFLGQKPYWKPLWNNKKCRPWQKCIKR